MLYPFFCPNFRYLCFYFSRGRPVTKHTIGMKFTNCLSLSNHMFKFSCEKEVMIFFSYHFVFRVPFDSLPSEGTPLSSSPLHSGMLVALINSMEHVKTHSGEKPNECNQCDYKYAGARIFRQYSCEKSLFPSNSPPFPPLY